MSGNLDSKSFREFLQAYPIRALTLLHDLYHQRMIRIAFRYTRDIDAAKDVVQETFLVVWNDRAKLVKFHQRSIENFLVRVVKFKAITWFKREFLLKEKIRLLDSSLFETFTDPVEKSMISKEMMEEFRRVIDTFPPKEKECLLMKIDTDMEVEEIAFRMKVKTKAVRRSLTSARKRLRAYWWGKNS